MQAAHRQQIFLQWVSSNSKISLPSKQRVHGNANAVLKITESSAQNAESRDLRAINGSALNAELKTTENSAQTAENQDSSQLLGQPGTVPSCPKAIDLRC